MALDYQPTTMISNNTVTLGELRRLNSEANTTKQKRALIVDTLPSLCSAINLALRYCARIGTEVCVLKITDNLAFIHNNYRIVVAGRRGCDRKRVFAALYDDLSFFHEILKQRYTNVYTRTFCHGNALYMHFDWSTNE